MLQGVVQQSGAGDSGGSKEVGGGPLQGGEEGTGACTIQDIRCNWLKQNEFTFFLHARIKIEDFLLLSCCCCCCAVVIANCARRFLVAQKAIKRRCRRHPLRRWTPGNAHLAIEAMETARQR